MALRIQRIESAHWTDMYEVYSQTVRNRVDPWQPTGDQRLGNDVDDPRQTWSVGSYLGSFARAVLPDLRLVVQDHVQQRVTDFQFSVVFDIAQFAKFVHEKAHA